MYCVGVTMSRLPTYRGFAQDNLNAFVDDLTSYYSIKNITDDIRKSDILWAQLWHATKIFADSKAITHDAPIVFEHWVTHLYQRFIIPDIIARRHYDFYDISQGINESPRDLAV